MENLYLWLKAKVGEKGRTKPACISGTPFPWNPYMETDLAPDSSE